MKNIDGLFPITVDPACKLKWSWSTIRLYDGTTCSCHRCNHHTFDMHTFDFHNTPEKITQRKTMLRGEWPTSIGCEFCRDVELCGGDSDRMFQKSTPGYPSELDLDNACVNVIPTTVEVYFDNKCNLGCVYCVPKLSSKIQQEIKKFGRFKHNFNRTNNEYYKEIFPTYVKHEKYNSIKDKFWLWMKKHSSKLLRFHILGGEPFYQNDMDVCIDFFDKHPNSALELNIVSNLTIPHTKFCSYIDRLKSLVHNKKVKRIDITVSIDDWGNTQEYTRYGIDLTVLEKNMHYMLMQEDWLRININQTLTVLSIKQMAQLQHKINEWRELKPIAQYLGFVTHWDFLHPSIFPYQVWKDAFNNVLNIMKQNLSDWDNNNSYKLLSGIMLQLQQSSEYDETKIGQMKLYLDEIDYRRGTNWRTTFPYLDI